MKYLLLLLLILWTTPVSAAAPTLATYSDSARTVACSDFTTNTVYIKSGSFKVPTVYRIIFWDGAGDNVSQQDLTGATLNANATLQHHFVLPDGPGTWHCVAYPDGYQPTCYDPSDSNIVAECTFAVQPGAIPEFSDVIAGVAVAGMCLMVFWIMRRRVR